MRSAPPTLLVVSWHPPSPSQQHGSNSRLSGILSNLTRARPVLLTPGPGTALFGHRTFSPFRLPRFLRRFSPANLDIFACFGKRAFDSAVKALDGITPAWIECEHLWSYPLARRLASEFGIPLVLVEQNVEALYALRTFRSRSVSRVVARYERRAVLGSDAVVACSDFDADYLAAQYRVPPEKIWVIPNGVDLPPLSAPPPDELLARLAGRKIVLFMGSTTYLPNAEAISILERELVPRIRAVHERVAFLILGGPKPADLSRIDQGIVFTGYVPDKQSYLLAADVCVAPLLSGSGTRLKILEYAAHGRPIVATSVGAEGLDLHDDRELFIRDDWDAFAAAVCTLLAEPQTGARLGSRARQAVEAKYQWSAIAMDYEQRLIELSKHS